MTGFLDQLATTALGVEPAGAARLALPSRYAQPLSSRAPSQVDVGSIGEALQPPPVVASTPIERIDDGRRLSGKARTPTNDADAFFGESATGAFEHSLEPLPFETPSTKAVSQQAEARYMARPTTTEPLVSPVIAARGVVRVDSDPIPGEDFPSVRTRKDSSAADGLRAPTVATPFRQAVQAAPLSQAAVTGRVAADQQARPVIHVTIDRIEVRAPAPASKPATIGRPRPQSTVSLADYLREGGGRK
jgi:hypothetical protein